MADLTRIKELAPYAARRKAPANFEVQEIRDAFAEELRKVAGSINNFQKNKYDLFEIIMQEVDQVVPARLTGAVGPFANVHNVAFNEKVVVKRPLGRNRARQFVTRAAAMGVYRTFRLDNETFSVDTFTIGAGVSIDFQRILDGADDLADLVDIVTESMLEYTYMEIQRALRAAFSTQVPAANRVDSNTFEAEGMLKLIRTAAAYSGGTPSASRAVIFAPPEFIHAMGADAIVPGTNNTNGIYHPDDIDSIHKTGYIKLFRGTPVVEIPQSFVDDNNDKTWIDPQLAYVLPTGGSKVVDVVYEGGVQIYDHINRDQSIEIMYNKRLGVSISTYHNWGIYRNTGITQTMYDA